MGRSLWVRSGNNHATGGFAIFKATRHVVSIPACWRGKQLGESHLGSLKVLGLEGAHTAVTDIPLSRTQSHGYASLQRENENTVWLCALWECKSSEWIANPVTSMRNSCARSKFCFFFPPWLLHCQLPLKMCKIYPVWTWISSSYHSFLFILKAKFLGMCMKLSHFFMFAGNK